MRVVIDTNALLVSIGRKSKHHQGKPGKEHISFAVSTSVFFQKQFDFKT